MIGALLYLRLMSLRNRVVSGIGRLRQPKYLAGALATAAYVYYFFVRRLGAPLHALGAGGIPAHRPGAGPPSEGSAAIGAAIIFILMLGRQALAWIAPPDQPGLHFSEAEIAFLFPAPLGRRALVHFNLISSQLGILVSALILTLLYDRFGSFGGSALSHAAGWWVIFSALRLHSTGVGLAVSRRVGGRDRAPRGRMIALGVLGVILAATVWEFYRHARPPAPEEISNPSDLGLYLGALFDAGFLHWLLLPFRWIAGPFTASTGRGFLLALGPALTILAALYLWVVRLETPFEEGSIARAEKRAQFRTALRSGARPRLGRGRPKARREPFRLADTGWPGLAFLWKNLLAIQAWFNLRIFLTIIAVVAGLVTFNLRLPREASTTESFAPAVLILAGLAAFYTLLAGPQLLRQDLRNDLANADILKTYPLAGWQVLLGELLTPTAILTGLLWLTLLAAEWALGQMGDATAWLGSGERLILTLCAAAVVPPLCGLQLLIPNGAALLFPGWFQATRGRAGGLEALGQRLIFAFGQLFAVVLALLPAVLLAAGVFVAAHFWLHLLLPARVATGGATIAATAAALAIVGGEVGCGLWWLGTRFEKFDLTSELRP